MKTVNNNIQVIEDTDAFNEFDLNAIIGGYSPSDRCGTFTCGTNNCGDYACDAVSKSCDDYLYS